MRFVFAFIVGSIVVASAGHAQTTPKEKPPLKGKKIDSLPGFRKYTIDGFTVLIQDEVLKEQESGNYKRKPLEALEIELKLVSKSMTKAQADKLRSGVQVWVEWDVREALNNGRTGNAYGIYLGTHPRPILIGKDPVFVTGIRILQMKLVTARHQKDDAHETLFLHEFAHAVHDQVIGLDYQPIKDAFKQALERKLYDKSLYAATNEKEFFAELSCAYLDKLDYFPHNRPELKKHDPFTYKVMEEVWGKRQDKVAVKKESTLSLDAKLDALKLGEHLAGPTLKKDDLIGKIVVMSFWGNNAEDTVTSLQRLQIWHEELGEYGLMVLGEVSWGQENLVPMTEKMRVKALQQIRAGSITFPHYFNGVISGLRGTTKYPHALLFDTSGQCIYRGDAFGLETEMRSALGKEIVAAAGIDKFAPPVAAFAEALERGQAPASVLQKLLVLYRSESGAKAEQAKALLLQLTAPGKKRLEEGQALMKSDPVAAYERLEPLTSAYRNTQVATKAAALMTQLKSDKAVAAEVRARPMLEGIKKLDTTLSGRPGSFDPSLPKFQQENGGLIGQLRDGVEKMKKAHPKTKALDVAMNIAKRYGVEVK